MNGRMVISMTIFVLCIYCIGGTSCIGGTPLNGQYKVCSVESRALPEQEKWDTNYTAMYAASDGKVYMGLNQHGYGGNIAVYDPETDSMKLLGDMHEMSGEKNLGREPHAKVHTQICEGSDGKIYFGTHISAWFNFAKISEREGNPGGRWCVYDPETDLTTDLGIGLPRNGIIAMTMDQKRERLYGLSCPMSHLIYYDIKTKVTVDVGVVQNWLSTSRVMVIDDRGCVYGFWNDGRLWKYDPVKDRTFNLLVQMPQRDPGVPMFRSFFETEHGMVGVARGEGGKWYGLETESSYLFEYDPYKGKEGTITLLTQMTPDRYVGKRNVPYGMLSFCKDSNDVFYYAANTQLQDEPQRPYWGEGYGTAMITYDLKTGVRKDEGIILAENNRLVMIPNAATCGPDGTIYFMAMVNEEGTGPVRVDSVADLVLEKEGEIARRGIDYFLRMCIYKPGSSK